MSRMNTTVATAAAESPSANPAARASAVLSVTRNALSGQSSHPGIGDASTSEIASGPSVTMASTAQTIHSSPGRSLPLGYERIRCANATNARPERR